VLEHYLFPFVPRLPSYSPPGARQELCHLLSLTSFLSLFWLLGATTWPAAEEATAMGLKKMESQTCNRSGGYQCMAMGALAHFKIISPALPPSTCPTAFCSPAKFTLLY